MTEPNRLPLRVLVKGASTVGHSSWMGRPTSDVAIPRVVEATILAAGHPVEVRCTATAAERTKVVLRSWQEEVLAWSPDVVILGYGETECTHLFLPRWLEPHANPVRGRRVTVRHLYRRRLLRPVWMVLAKVQRALDARLPPNLLSYRPRRVAADLERMIEVVRTVASPLVLIPDIPPPGVTHRTWFPGMPARIDAMNQTLHDLVARVDAPDVRIAPIKDLGPDAHREHGEAMADIILEWASHQTHLDLAEARARRLARRALHPVSRTGD